MFFLSFLLFFFLKDRSTREKTCKEVQLLERTQQRIKLKQLKVIVSSLCHTKNFITLFWENMCEKHWY